MTTCLRIVAFNDVYALDNLPRLRTLVEYAREGADRLLVTLAGDFLAPSVLSSLDNGRGMVECLNMIGVTHVTFGNHEDDIPLGELRKRVRELSAVWLATNVVGFDPPLPASNIVSIAPGKGAASNEPLRVGLLGVVVGDPLVYRHPPFGTPIADPNQAAIQEANRLLAGGACSLVIALTHQSIAADIALGEMQHGAIPLILGGHEHTVFDRSVGGARILKAGVEAENAFIVDVVWADEQASPTISARLEAVSRYAEEPRLRALVDRHMRPVLELGKATLLDLRPTEKGRELSSKGVRSRQTSMGTLVCSLLRDSLGSDACVFNGGGIRAGQDYRVRFTYRDLEEELPFANEMVTVPIPGTVLEAAIRASRSKAPAEDGGFLQVDDGIAFTESGGLSTVAKVPFNPAREYRVSLVRDLLFGLDCIEPLVTFGKAHAKAIPPDGTGLFPRELLVRAFSVELWKQIGGFAVIDANHDGVVTEDEVAAAVARARHGEKSEGIAELVLHALDADQDNVISPEDFRRRS